MKDFMIVCAFILLGAFVTFNFISGGPTTIKTEATRIGGIQISEMQKIDK